MKNLGNLKMAKKSSIVGPPFLPIILPSNTSLNLQDQWISTARAVAMHPATFNIGSRKILRPVHWTATLDDSLSLADVNYSSAKMKMLRRYYHHEESQSTAMELWEKRLEMKKYGSVSFTTFNHYKKGGGSHVASIFGPCIQSVIITLLKKDQYIVDVCYRSTEFFKKFPADLVLIRDVLLPPFSIPKDTPVSFYFANVTVHSMYILNIFHLIGDPIDFLEELKEKDEYFWRHVVSWLNLYLGGKAINFKQANREAEFFQRANPSKRKQIAKYAEGHKK